MAAHDKTGPTLGLALPVYNGERFLAEALESVLAQEFTDWELLVCDNGSTDRTGEIARKYAAADSRIRYVCHERNIGLAPNHTYGFHHTGGEFFAWVHADNRYHPDYFARCVAELRADPSVSCVHATAQEIDPEGRLGRVWREGLRCDDPDVAVRFRDLTEPDHMCFAFFGVARRAVLADTKLLASFDSADNLTIVELALRGRIRVLDEPLFLHREHPNRVIRQVPSARSRYLVFDPAWQGRVPFPIVNIGRQFALAVLRAPISTRDKVRCLAELRGWLRVNWLRILRTCARGGLEYARLAAGAVRRRALPR